jgi:D-arabinose 1-dehydrogenase-like Zn-dependent alcohol dehydrogenase
MRCAEAIDLRPAVEVFRLEDANEALARLRDGRLHGAAVLVNHSARQE